MPSETPLQAYSRDGRYSFDTARQCPLHSPLLARIMNSWLGSTSGKLNYE